MPRGGSRRGGALQPVDGNAKVAAEVTELREELLTKTTENKELAEKAAALEAALADMSSQLSSVTVSTPAPAAAAAATAAGGVTLPAVPGVVRNPFAPAPADGGGGGAASSAAPKKAKKDVDHPKRPLTAYLIYSASVREEVAAAHPDKKMTELAAVLGAAWKALPDAERAPHEAAAAADRSRYEREMVAYTAKREAAATEEAAIAKYNEGVKAAAAMAYYEAHLAEEAAAAAEAATKKGAAKKARAAEGAPKRPVSAYLFFAADARAGVKAAHPDASATELMALIAAEWKAATEATTKKGKAALAQYTAAAEADKARYETEMAEWKAAKEAAAAAARDAEAAAYEAAKAPALAAYKKEAADAQAAKAWKAAAKTAAAAARAEKATARAERREAKAAAIKRPTSAYFYYAAAVRAAVRAELGEDAPVTAVATETGRRWKEVDDAGRAPYVAAAEADKARYEAAKAEAAAAAAGQESC